MLLIRCNVFNYKCWCFATVAFVSQATPTGKHMVVTDSAWIKQGYNICIYACYLCLHCDRLIIITSVSGLWMNTRELCSQIRLKWVTRSSWTSSTIISLCNDNSIRLYVYGAQTDSFKYGMKNCINNVADYIEFFYDPNSADRYVVRQIGCVIEYWRNNICMFYACIYYCIADIFNSSHHLELTLFFYYYVNPGGIMRPAWFHRIA